MRRGIDFTAGRRKSCACRAKGARRRMVQTSEARPSVGTRVASTAKIPMSQLFQATYRATQPIPPAPISASADLYRIFENQGYLTLDNVVDPIRLEVLRASLLLEYNRKRQEGALFEGGGTVSGHLNCFPGAASRFVYETLEEKGIFDIVRRLSPAPLRLPNVGCNLNLPGSAPQNEHIDGYTAQPFLIVNVAATDTNLSNGAMEILLGTHRKDYKYWELMLDKPERRRLCMKQGDVVIRTSRLWHRGMSNHTERARPMLAFTWEDGGSARVDPYDVHEGRVAFLPNRYGTGRLDRIRERAFASAPRLGSVYCAIRSMLKA
jgi:hypothetical protein